jgi:hypothetical protein
MSKILRPKFRRFPTGGLIYYYSEEARKFADAKKHAKGKPEPLLSSDKEVVYRNAVKTVVQLGLDKSDRLNVLGQHVIQFGAYRGKTFIWMLENGLGWCSWFVDNLNKSKEVPNETPLSVNKHFFKKYCAVF